MVDGKLHPIRNGRLNGDQITFDMPGVAGTVRRLSGRVTPDAEIRGEGWDARRQG
jgi:hypothetical protein